MDPLSLDRAFYRIATETKSLDARVREFVQTHFKETFIPSKDLYDTASSAGKHLIAFQETFNYLFEDDGVAKAWLEAHTHPETHAPWVNRGGFYGEREDLLAFDSHGWKGKDDLLTHDLEHFLEATSAADQVTAYVQELYDAKQLHITTGLDAILAKHTNVIEKLTSLDIMPKVPGVIAENPALPALQTAFKMLINELNGAQRDFILADGSVTSFSFDFIRDLLAKAMGQPVNLLSDYLVAHRHSRHVISSFFGAIQTILDDLNHTYKIGGLPALEAMRKTATPPSPFVEAGRVLFATWKASPTDRDGFEKQLKDLSATFGKAPVYLVTDKVTDERLSTASEDLSFGDQVLHRYWSYSSPASDGDMNWSLNHWRDSQPLMGKAIIHTALSFDKRAHSDTP